MRRVLILLTFAAALMACPPPAEACSCMVPGPPCSAAWESPVIFAGTVTEVLLARGSEPWGPRIVKFAITEAFRGVDGAEISLQLEGTSCDLTFKKGEDWLVYARNRGGKPGWTASMCSRTARLGDAGEDLRYLRLPDDRKPASQIIGQVRHQTRPLSGVPVVVSGDGTRHETTTDRDGRYSVRVPPYRAYSVEFGKVEGFVIAGDSRPVWLSHHLACGAVDAYAHYDGRVTGRVVDDRGRPVPFLPITLAASPQIPPGGFEEHAFTDVSGAFVFTGVQPATYVISPSTSLWRDTRALPPLTGSAVNLAASAHIDAGWLRLPPSVRTTLVEILIEDAEGKPAAGASVVVKQPDSHDAIYPGPRRTADASGAFRISLVAGRRYEIQAWHSRLTPGGVITETARTLIDATGLKPFRVRLAPFR